MGYEAFLQIWYFVILIPVSVATYYALMALDFSKLFKANSTWQIRVLSLLISLTIGFVLADGVFGIIDRLVSSI